MWAEIMGTIALVGSAISNVLTDKSSHDSRKNAKETGKRTYVDGRGNWRFTETKERVNTYRCADGGTYWYSASGLVQYKTGGREKYNEMARETAILEGKDIYPHRGRRTNYWVENETKEACTVFRECEWSNGKIAKEKYYFAYILNPENDWCHKGKKPYSVIFSNLYDIKEIDVLFYDVFLSQQLILFNTHVERMAMDNFVIENSNLALYDPTLRYSGMWRELSEDAKRERVISFVNNMELGVPYLISYTTHHIVGPELEDFEIPRFVENNHWVSPVDHILSLKRICKRMSGKEIELLIKDVGQERINISPLIVDKLPLYDPKTGNIRGVSERNLGINIYTKVKDI